MTIHLPHGQGWVVAAYQRHLRYRSTVDGTWTDAGDSAAIVPDAAVQIDVAGTAVPLR